MRLIFSTNDFKVLGGSYVDFPILLNSRMEIVDEVLFFLLNTALNGVELAVRKAGELMDKPCMITLVF